MKGAILLGAYILLILGIVYSGYTFYYGHNYQADIAAEYVQRAQATNDLGDMAHWLNQSIPIMQNYHGNPAWLFPTPDTDYDFIRANIQVDIQNCLKWSSANYSQFGYQQAVYNLQQTDNTISSHIQSANMAAWGNPFLDGAFLTLLILSIFLWAPLYEIGYRLDGYLEDQANKKRMAALDKKYGSATRN